MAIPIGPPIGPPTVPPISPSPSPPPLPTPTTVNFVIARVANIPGVFELDEVTMPDYISLPIFQVKPNGEIAIVGFTNPMPLSKAFAEAPMYIKHEGEAITVHLHYIDGTVGHVTFRSLFTPNKAVKKIRIPPSEHSKRFIIEIGFQVPVQVSTL